MLSCVKMRTPLDFLNGEVLASGNRAPLPSSPSPTAGGRPSLGPSGRGDKWPLVLLLRLRLWRDKFRGEPGDAGGLQGTWGPTGQGGSRPRGRGEHHRRTAGHVRLRGSQRRVRQNFFVAQPAEQGLRGVER